jgi:hypothetical protein
MAHSFVNNTGPCIVTLEFSFCEVYHNLSNVPKLKANMGIHTLVRPFRVGLNFTCSHQSSTGVEKIPRAKEDDTLIYFFQYKI